MRNLVARLAAAGARAARELADLVLPSDCAGCATAAVPAGVCDACLLAVTEPPAESRPTPAPAGLPRCFSAGRYDGVLRDLILAYKERGRRGLAGPLGYALAAAVLAGAGRDGAGRLVLVPVPATAAAARARQGDHMLRLARQAAARLRRAGWSASVGAPLRARARPDSAHLDRRARAAYAAGAFEARLGRIPAVQTAARTGARIVLVDDVLTTGATLAAVAARLADAGVPVEFAATIAATHLRVGVVAPLASLSPIAQISSDGSWDGGDWRAATS